MVLLGTFQEFGFQYRYPQALGGGEGRFGVACDLMQKAIEPGVDDGGVGLEFGHGVHGGTEDPVTGGQDPEPVVVDDIHHKGAYCLSLDLSRTGSFLDGDGSGARGIFHGFLSKSCGGGTRRGMMALRRSMVRWAPC